MIDDLRNSGMMQHLIEALERGEDIGHYGRLVFTMVARHFLTENQLLEYLQQNLSGDDARALYRQVAAHDYNPPRPQRILEWQQQQSFPICPDPDACNVYRDLAFPDRIYEHIQEFYEERSGTERLLVDVDDRHQQREDERPDDQTDKAERVHPA